MKGKKNGRINILHCRRVTNIKWLLFRALNLCFMYFVTLEFVCGNMLSTNFVHVSTTRIFRPHFQKNEK